MVFKDKSGRWRTRSLFMELNEDESKYESLFTLGPEDKDGKISVRRAYMEAYDPTEYIIATSLFGGMELWDHLCELDWFKVHVENWRRELQAKIKCEAINTVRIACEEGEVSTAQVGAAKWLATLEWEGNKVKSGRGPGRPVKTPDPETKLREALRSGEEIEEDFKRLT